MKRQLILCVIFLLSGSRYSHAQLASETKTADVCLVDALLRMDESRVSHCARFEGQKSSIHPTMDTDLSDIYGYSACAVEPARGEFHSYGYFRVLGREQSRITWADAIRVHPDRKLFRFGQERRDGSTPTKTGVESEEILEQNPAATWQYPEIDPFGMVFSIDGDLRQRGSNLATKIEFLNSMTLDDSSVMDNGNVRGTWISPSKQAKITIEFDSRAEFLPVFFRSQLWDDANKTLGMVIVVTRTEWLAPGSAKKVRFPVVPKTISMKTSAPDGRVTETKVHFQWVLDPEKRKFDFDKLIEDPPVNLRRYFDQFFDEAPPK